MAVPVKQNLSITRGDTETIVITMQTDSTAINITGRTYRAQIRATKDAATIAATLTCTITNASGGEVTCVLSAANSATLTPGTYYWDFEENNAGVISTIIAGTVAVGADVTR